MKLKKSGWLVLLCWLAKDETVRLLFSLLFDGDESAEEGDEDDTPEVLCWVWLFVVCCAASVDELVEGLKRGLRRPPTTLLSSLEDVVSVELPVLSDTEDEVSEVEPTSLWDVKDVGLLDEV